MNAFDILILILLLLAFVTWFTGKGLIMQLVGLATIIPCCHLWRQAGGSDPPGSSLRLIKLTPRGGESNLLRARLHRYRSR